MTGSLPVKYWNFEIDTTYTTIFNRKVKSLTQYLRARGFSITHCQARDEYQNSFKRAQFSSVTGTSKFSVIFRKTTTKMKSLVPRTVMGYFWPITGGLRPRLVTLRLTKLQNCPAGYWKWSVITHGVRINSFMAFLISYFIIRLTIRETGNTTRFWTFYKTLVTSNLSGNSIFFFANQVISRCLHLQIKYFQKCWLLPLSIHRKK